MNSKSIIFGIVLFIYLIPFSLAIDIELNIKDSFSAGERVYYQYSYYSDTVVNIKYFARVDCPSLVESMVALKEATIGPDNPLVEEFEMYESLPEDVDPQDCIAYASVIYPIDKYVQKDFRLATEPVFDLDLAVCGAGKCNNPVYAAGDEVLIRSAMDFNGIDDEPDAVVSGVLQMPDGSTESIYLPYSFEPEIPGTYIVSIIAEAQGYQRQTSASSFAVIEQKPKIIKEVTCNIDGKCSGKENAQNCPSDCKLSGDDDYCDKRADGICDKDCGYGEDPDCAKKGNTAVPGDILEKITDSKDEFVLVNMNLLWWIILIGSLIMMIVIVVYYVKKK